MAPHQEQDLSPLLGGVGTSCGHHEDWAGRRLLGWKQWAGCSAELMNMPAGSAERCPVHLGTAGQENGREQSWAILVMVMLNRPGAESDFLHGHAFPSLQAVVTRGECPVPTGFNGVLCT